MNYQNIPFYIATESISKSKEIGKILSRQNNTLFNIIDIPEIYNYLRKNNNFTCFVIQITGQAEILVNLVKSISQKNPNLPIILISSGELKIEEYRYFIRIGASDILVINESVNENEVLKNVINILNLKWRSFLYTKKENEKVFKASVVTANHEINQPLTVILNAIGLLKAELKQEAEKDLKVNSHLNFIAKGVHRIQNILDNLNKVKKLALKEYTPGVWMINLDENPTQQVKLNKTKINNKNTILIVDKNLEDKKVIENELRKMGLEIINAANLKEAEKIIDRYVYKIQAVLFSANVPVRELENTLFKINNLKEIVPFILIRNADLSAESLKIMDSTAFQVINKPVSSKALKDAIVNSVIVAN